MVNLNLNGELISFVRLHPEATLPRRATPGSLGFDVTVVSKGGAGFGHVIAPGEQVLLPTGLAFAKPLPPNLGAFLFARSSLYKRYGVILTNSVGVIDGDYADELKVAVRNMLDHDVVIPAGERIAQLVFLPLWPVAVQFAVQQEDFTGERTGGFGSTGHSVARDGPGSVGCFDGWTPEEWDAAARARFNWDEGAE